MKHSIHFYLVDSKRPHPNRLQIYLFLLIRQNVNLLFSVSIELKKLIIPFYTPHFQQIANCTLQFYTLLLHKPAQPGNR